MARDKVFVDRILTGNLASDLLSVAKNYGMEVRSTGGSHHVFSHPSVRDPLSVPAHRPIKAIYIKRFVALIDQIQE